MREREAVVSVTLHGDGPVRGELYEYGPGRVHKIAPHGHAAYQFGYSATGAGGFRIGRRWVDTVPGRPHCVAPHVEHATGRDGLLERPVSYYMVYVDPGYVGPLLGDEARRPAVAPFASAAAPGVGHVIRALASGPVQEPAREDMVLTLFEALSPAPPAAPADGGLAARARDYLAAHADRPVSLRELSAACGAHASRVRRAFRSAYGLPPHRFALLERLHRARVLLAAGCAPAEAAQRLGFADQPHLTRLMRRYYGHTPARVAARPAHFVQDACPPPR